MVRALTIWAALAVVPLAAGATEPLPLDDAAPEMAAPKRPTKPVDPALRQEFVDAYNARGANDREVFDRYLPRLGAAAMLDYIEERFPQCHGQAHALGSALYAGTKDLAGSLEICGQRCTGACMHGVIRQAFGEKTLAQVEGTLDEFCGGPVMSAQKPGNCAHAMGHALMVVAHRDLGAALTGCSKFSNAAMGYYCATGVYMEYFADPPKPDPKTAGPHFPCDAQELYPAACYRYLGGRRVLALRNNIAQFTEECLAISKRTQRLGCFHGLGAAYAFRVLRNPALLADGCKSGTPDDQAMCIEGAIEKIAELDEQAALKACAGLTDNAAVCTAAAHGRMYRLDKPTLRLYTNRD